MHVRMSVELIMNLRIILDARQNEDVSLNSFFFALLQIVLRHHVVRLLELEALACLRVSCVTLCDLVRVYVCVRMHECVPVYACLLLSRYRNFRTQIHGTIRWQKFFTQV